MDTQNPHFEILNQLQTGIVVHAPDTQVVFSNARACELLGLSVDQMRGKTAMDPVWHFVTEDGHPLPPSDYPVNRAISSGQPTRAMVLGIHASVHRQTVWVLASAAPKHDAAGTLTQVVVDFYDVTARKLTEDKGRAHEAFTTAVLDSLTEHIAVIDKSGTIMAVNEAWRRFARSNGAPESLQSSIGMSYFCSCVAPAEASAAADEPDCFAGVRAVLSGVLDDFTVDYPCHSPSEKRWFRMSVTPLTGEHGGAVVSHLNITEQRNSEEQARCNMQLLHESIEAIDEAFVIFDADERLVYCNEKYRQLYPQLSHLIVPGIQFEDLIRRGATIGFYQESVGRVEEWVQERLAAYRSGNQTRVQHIASGRVVRAVERKMADGHTVGFRIDITELVKATEAAVAASRAKGQFLANMSHEIRTPMNAILGMLKLLQNTALSRQQLDYTDKAESAAKSLLGLINDVLDFSKVEAGKMDLDIHPFRIDRLMRDLSVLLAASVAGKHLDVLFNIDPQLPEVVLGDPMRLRQVLINLGSNAVKFTATGQVVVAVRLQSLQDDLASIEFSVTDTGIGIAPNHQGRIFDGFSQAETSTTRKFGGTGLGLAISQRLVRLMGGELGLYSKPGQGSSFAFVLQLTSVTDTATELQVAPRPSESVRSVLVVDDNPVAADLTLRMIRSWGWPCEWASSGAQALVILEQRSGQGTPIEVIYLDCQMPDMDGWETAHRVRQREPGTHAVKPVIVMLSAHGRESLAQRTQQEQERIDSFLVRPVTASMLFDATVESQLSHTQDVQKPKAGGRRLDKLRLLVVEDNLINQQVAEELLMAEGALVSLAANGKLGVEAVAAAQPQFDAVLMDIQMPVMDGYAATKVIRQELGLTQLPIIAMTANALASDRLECLSAGMNEHVGKPFDISHLVSVIARMLNGNQAH